MFHILKHELQETGTTSFYVRARPSMSYTKAVEVMEDESIKIDIAAPAEHGKANIELIKYLAETFSVTKDQVQIVSGKTARIKLIRIVS